MRLRASELLAKLAGFERFTDDFAVRVFFYEPDGGEEPT